eukprot:jgi/Chrzof1/14315/UNPLg00587.t1
MTNTETLWVSGYRCASWLAGRQQGHSRR